MTNNRSIQDLRQKASQPSYQASHLPSNRTSAVLDDYKYVFFPQLLSECATRGIFEWLRSTGYPSSERPIYRHSWLDLEGTDEEEAPDDAESDVEAQRSPKKMQVERWLDGLEDIE